MIGSALGAIALIGGVAVGSAQAAPPGNCPSSYVCVYDGGTRVVATAGNWHGNVRATRVFNHGVRYPGADHVQVGYYYYLHHPLAGWYRVDASQCVHYYPGPGTYDWRPTALGVHVTSLRWRGEC